MSKWIEAADSIFPYQCDHCGYRASFPWFVCPQCDDLMEIAKDNNVPDKKDGEQG